MNALAKTMIAAAVFGIAATTTGQGQETHTVSWYMQHQQEMTSRMAWCSLHPQQNDIDCVNAMHACSNAIKPGDTTLPACATTRPTPDKQ